MAEEAKQSGLWTALAAIGGVLSGVAAILGLFIAQPSAITVLLPREVIARAAEANLSAAAPQPAATAASYPQMAPPPPVEATPPASAPPAPTQMLAPGLALALISITDTGERYVATIAFTNSTDSDLSLAVASDGAFEANVYLSDDAGGSCQMAANGEGWGTLPSAYAERSPYYNMPETLAAIPQGGQVQHTIFFNKQRCATLVRPDRPLAITASFVVVQGSERRLATAGFNQLVASR